MEPITREEVFMKAAASGEATPEPITRTEYFLKKIADNAKGGGGVTSWNDLTDKPFGENKDGTIKPLDEKYLPGPKLLGELVLTNENCTQIDNHSLRFNDDLREQVASLLETASNLKGRLFSVEVAIGDMESRFTAEYSDEPTGRWLSAVYLSLLNGDSGEITMQACTLGEYRFALTYQDALAGILGGYPMTIKVYAT